MDAGGVLARKAQAQRPAPAALLLGDLRGRGLASDSFPAPSPGSPHLREPKGKGVRPSLQTTPRHASVRSPTAQLAHHWGSFLSLRNLPTRLERPSDSHGHFLPGTFLLCHAGKVEKGVKKREEKEEGQGRVEVAADRKGKGQGFIMVVRAGSDRGRKFRCPPSV